MGRVRFWSLYTSVYTLIIGVSCLVLTDLIPFIRYTPSDKAWVKITGMCLMAMSYFNYTISKERPIHIVRASLLNQTFCAIFMAVVAIRSQAVEVYAIEAIILIGLAGAAIAYRAEREALDYGSGPKLFRTAKWNLYVAAYTFVYGTGSAFFPTPIVPLLGFGVPVDWWVHIAGMCFCYLCYFNIATYRYKGHEPIILSILLLRVWFVAILIVLGILGYAWFVYLSAAIVGVGVIGTFLTYRAEKRRLLRGWPESSIRGLESIAREE